MEAEYRKTTAHTAVPSFLSHIVFCLSFFLSFRADAFVRGLWEQLPRKTGGASKAAARARAEEEAARAFERRNQSYDLLEDDEQEEDVAQKREQKLSKVAYPRHGERRMIGIVVRRKRRLSRAPLTI
jgi:hypothetical protein